jgi:hypothetical protein
LQALAVVELLDFAVEMLRKGKFREETQGNLNILKSFRFSL